MRIGEAFNTKKETGEMLNVKSYAEVYANEVLLLYSLLQSLTIFIAVGCKI